jgi:transcriptional regulator of acetoin/glycerol metabolism
MDKRLRAEYREQAVTETSNVFLRWARLKQQAKTAPRSESATTDIDSATLQAGPEKNERLARRACRQLTRLLQIPTSSRFCNLEFPLN